jgi:hypothetical protein
MKSEVWFKHDKNARRDPKIQALRAKHGAEGYGIYFMLIEVMAEQADYKLQKFPLMVAGLSVDLGIKEELLEKILHFIVNECELFEQNDTHIWSESLVRRMSAYDDTRKKRAESGRIGGSTRVAQANPSKCLANAKQMLSKPQAVLKQNEAEESRVDKSREERGEGEADPPTIHDVRGMAEAEGIKADPDKFFHYQTSKGWKDLVDWKAALRYWARSEFVKTAAQPSKTESRSWVDTAGEQVKRNNAWHEAHIKGGKCSFCGAVVPSLSVCQCSAYVEAFEAFKSKGAK